MIRQFILFLIMLGLLTGGGYLLRISLAHPSYYSIMRGVAMGGFLFSLGAYVAWEDFIKLGITKYTRSRSDSDPDHG